MELPPELILELTEHLDVATLRSLMLVNKTVHATIRRHERSICKPRLVALALPPTDRILSSHGTERHIVPVQSFRGASELELRGEHVDAILGSNFMGMWAPPGPQPLTACQRRLLTRGLRRALHLCDRLADTAAHCSVDSAGPHHGLTSRPPRPRHQVGAPAPSEVRGAQIAYIRSLALEDLSWLYCMVEVAGGGFVRTRKYEAEDPVVWEKITVFEEAVLRHGSWLLWAHIAGGEAMKDMVGDVISAGLQELKEWETGKEASLPGLRMSLLDAARGLVGDQDDAPATRLMSMVRRMVTTGTT